MKPKTDSVTAMPDTQSQVRALLARARTAQRAYEAYSQAQVDEVVTAVAWGILNPHNNQMLSELAVNETGLGNVEDKLTKNRRKTLGLLRDLMRSRSVGVISESAELGLIEIARPVGVVGAVVPSTNPVATPFNKTLNALKGRNAIILSPSPKGQVVCERVVDIMRQELARVGAPEDLVQMLPAPGTKAATYELMQQVDMVVVTGSQNNVRAAYESGTPAIGVGVGNVPVIVDASADMADAARKIAASKTFDNATSCSSENSLIVLESAYAELMDALKHEGGCMLGDEDKRRLQDAMWVKGKLNRQVIARPAAEICQVAGLDSDNMAGCRFLMVQEQGIGPDYPFSDEKLSPVLAVYRVPDFDAAFDTARRLLEYKGAGHSIGIHSQDQDHVMRLGLDLPVCRVIVNQAHCFATGGSFDNGLPFSLSMGCGTWGGNSISENLSLRHYLNITRISRTIEADEPTVDEMFGKFWRKYDIAPTTSGTGNGE